MNEKISKPKPLWYVRSAWWLGIYLTGVCYYDILAYYYADANFRDLAGLSPLVIVIGPLEPVLLTALRIQDFINDHFKNPQQGVFNDWYGIGASILIYTLNFIVSLTSKSLWIFGGLLGILVFFLLWNTHVWIQTITD